jgi:hypothetical protein
MKGRTSRDRVRQGDAVIAKSARLPGPRADLIWSVIQHRFERTVQLHASMQIAVRFCHLGCNQAGHRYTLFPDLEALRVVNLLPEEFDSLAMGGLLRRRSRERGGTKFRTVVKTASEKASNLIKQQQ